MDHMGVCQEVIAGDKNRLSPGSWKVHCEI